MTWILARAVVAPLLLLLAGTPAPGQTPAELAAMKADYRRPAAKPVENRPLVELGRALFWDPRASASGETLTIKPGDTLVFRNDDRFAHNVFSRTAGQEFDLGTMRPGVSGQHSFDKPGTVEVECALHPQMKFKVEVKPQIPSPRRGEGRYFSVISQTPSQSSGGGVSENLRMRSR